MEDLYIELRAMLQSLDLQMTSQFHSLWSVIRSDQRSKEMSAAELAETKDITRVLPRSSAVQQEEMESELSGIAVDEQLLVGADEVGCPTLQQDLHGDLVSTGTPLTLQILSPVCMTVTQYSEACSLLMGNHGNRYSDHLKNIFSNCPGEIEGEKNIANFSTPISDLQKKINEVFDKIQLIVPNATFTYLNRTTNGEKSKIFIASPRQKYCIGEEFVIQIDMYDHLGRRKGYGGDFIRARIFSDERKASVCGRVEDFNNGSYHVHFPLYWEGQVKVSAKLFHPSEGISALWRARHASLGVLGFEGKFVSRNQEATTKCGFKLNTDKEVCEYVDPDDENAFYCIKPEKLPCDSLHDMKSFDIHLSYLSKEEQQMFQRSNIGVEIPTHFKFIDVVSCNKMETNSKPKCQTGMSSPFPSGYFLNDLWIPVYCNMTPYRNGEDYIRCLHGKKLFLIGDSTIRQFIMHFTEGNNIVKYFGYRGKGFSQWQNTLLALNMEKDIYVSFKRHGFPLESSIFYYFQEDMYTSRQIDMQGGGKDTIIMITMGQHFRQFPLHLFIKRAINIRRAIERLFLRSPDTKVIIKTENIREITNMVERLGDFHGYCQYLVLREVFKGLDVGFVDAWDMSVSSGIENVHPPGNLLENIMSLSFTFACL
ncbi:NXPE family member 4-like [Bombina bombina]|uniref:NXPE family member 4-like n=1 Tax=Bombina bombina TaxID=8345 RepID=UPI00235A57E4|nr:NXPE family member 4-like [Bombina bombina]